MRDEMEIEKLKLEIKNLKEELSSVSASAFVSRMIINEIKNWDFPLDFRNNLEALLSLHTD